MRTRLIRGDVGGEDRAARDGARAQHARQPGVFVHQGGGDGGEVGAIGEGGDQVDLAFGTAVVVAVAVDTHQPGGKYRSNAHSNVG